MSYNAKENIKPRAQCETRWVYDYIMDRFREKGPNALFFQDFIFFFVNILEV